MNLLVTYDVSTTSPAGRRRLRQVARVCEGFGERVQYSVFEVHCSRADYVQLLAALTAVVVPTEDSLRIYPIDRDMLEDVVHIGIRRNLGTDDAWTV